MRVLSVFLLIASLFSGCAGNPNSLRGFSDLDGSWIAVAESADCGISQSFAVDISGQAFGALIPQTNIFLSGVVRDRAVRTASTQQQAFDGKGEPNTEISAIDVVFDSNRSARGTWRSSRCSGVVTLTKRGV